MSAGGLLGMHFIMWGHEEMFPHVGRHVGYEPGPAINKVNREAYLAQAHVVIQEGACRSFLNVDPTLCKKEDDPESKIVFYQDSGPGPKHKRLQRYVSAQTPRCFIDS